MCVPLRAQASPRSRARRLRAADPARLAAADLNCRHTTRCRSQDKLRSPLFLSARGGHIAIVEMLLDSGADPNMPVERVRLRKALACGAAEVTP